MKRAGERHTPTARQVRDLVPPFGHAPLVRLNGQAPLLDDPCQALSSIIYRLTKSHGRRHFGCVFASRSAC
jgi:hypothetical protein